MFTPPGAEYPIMQRPAFGDFTGGIELLGLLGDRLGLSGWFWRAIGGLNDNLNALGFLIIGVFVATWAGSGAATSTSSWPPS